MKQIHNEKLLVVDDEEDICEILQFNLKNEGYDVHIAHSAEQAIEMIHHQCPYSLILLDVMMDGMSGFKMAEKLKNQLNLSIPIIFLTAKDTENDMLTGFSIGGDDYISKPFSVKEVIARVKAVLRRMSTKDATSNKNLIQIEDLIINIPNKTVRIASTDIQLTKKEFDILSLLVSAPNRVFHRDEILSTVWNNNTCVLDRTVDVHIARLRKKMERYGDRIVNRSNYGYSFNL